MSYRQTAKIKLDLAAIFNKTYDDRKTRDALRFVISNPEFKRQYCQCFAKLASAPFLLSARDLCDLFPADLCKFACNDS
jgi:hypothetical protein